MLTKLNGKGFSFTQIHSTRCPTCGEGESAMPEEVLMTYPKHLPKVRISKAEGNVRHMKSFWSGFALSILTALCLWLLSICLCPSFCLLKSEKTKMCAWTEITQSCFTCLVYFYLGISTAPAMELSSYLTIILINPVALNNRSSVPPLPFHE